MLEWESWKQSFVFMFVLLERVFIYLRLGILATSIYVYFCVFKRVCTHVRLGILQMSVLFMFVFFRDYVHMLD